MYAGLAILFFFLVIYLQQVAGYSALRSGLDDAAGDDRDVRCSRAASARSPTGYGPRLFMGVGPLVAAGGILLLLRVGMHVSYWTDLLPALLVFALGLSMTVAPLTATVLADADESDAGIASAINNAVARVAGLVGISVIGVVVAGTLIGDTFAPNQESVRAFHEAMADLRGARRGRRGRSGSSGSSTRGGRCAPRAARAASSPARPKLWLDIDRHLSIYMTVDVCAARDRLLQAARRALAVRRARPRRPRGCSRRSATRRA